MHVVTHSHLDAGWVKGVRRCYQTAKVIFKSVISELEKDRKRTYTVGDIYFFRRFYFERIDLQDRITVLVKRR